MQDMDDKDLEILFRETRVIDHRSAPGFDRDWNAARPRLALGRKTSFNYAIAAACILATVVVVAVAVRIGRMRSSIPQQSARSQDPGQAAKDAMTRGPKAPDGDPAAVSRPGGTGNSERNPGAIGAASKKKLRHQYSKPELHGAPSADHELLSTWRSPTEFLLRSPADELLRAVPSIQDSMVRIDDK